MEERRWEVGICGTFDVANYGDLLFPLIAESELTERLGAVTLHRFSYYARTPPEWPFEVTSVTELPRTIDRLDGLIIGGGHLIRFDKHVAPAYAPPTPEIHHPTGYWLTPALIALQHDVPVVWNAPGVHGDPPAWASPLMKRVLALSRYVSVRDQRSRSVLERLTGAPVAVVPDTVFRLQRLVNLNGPPSAGFTRLCQASHLDAPYIVIQATPDLEWFVRFIKSHAARFQNFRFVALPIGPAFCERQEIIDADLPGIVRLPDWPSPLVVAELIGRSEAVVGHSYHLFITALASGVPVFTRQNLSAGKYSALQGFESIFVLLPNGEPDIEWFLARVGRTTPPAGVRATDRPLGEHWDRIEAELRAERAPTAPAINRFWQSLPALLEDAATREDEAVTASAKERADAQQRLEETRAASRAVAAETQKRLDEALRQLAADHQEAAETQKRLDEALQQLAAAQPQTAETQKRLEEALQQLAAAQQEAAETQKRLDEELAAAQQEAAGRQEMLDYAVKQRNAARAETAERDARIAEIMTSISWRLTAPLRFAGLRRPKRRRQLINLSHIERHRLETHPYRWAAIKGLFNSADAALLSATYPCDRFKLVASHDGEKEYRYEARALIEMGAQVVACPDELSEAWRALACDLLSPEYRAAMTSLTGYDLAHVPMEVNVFHYGPGGTLGAHKDLPEKLVTHVLYFNRSWNSADGGCLRILRSADPADLVAEIEPIVGNSSVIVRSENSWHAVSRVVNSFTSSRRSVTVTFYRPGSVSTMWPPGDTAPLHSYQAADLT